MRKSTIESTIVETRDLLEDLLREAKRTEKKPPDWKKFEWSVVNYLNTSSGSEHATCVGGKAKYDITIDQPITVEPWGTLAPGNYEVKSIQAAGVLAKLGDEKAGRMLSDEFVASLMSFGSYLDQHTEAIITEIGDRQTDLKNQIKYFKAPSGSGSLPRSRAYSRLEISKSLYGETFDESGIVKHDFIERLQKIKDEIYNHFLKEKIQKEKERKNPEVKVQYKIGDEKAVTIGKVKFNKLVTKIVPELSVDTNHDRDSIRNIAEGFKSLFRLYQIIELLQEKSSGFDINKVVADSTSSVLGFFGVEKSASGKVEITYIPSGTGSFRFNNSTQGGRIALAFDHIKHRPVKADLVEKPDGVRGAENSDETDGDNEEESEQSPKAAGKGAKESTNESRARTPKREFSAVGGASPAAPGGMGPNVPLGMGPKATGKGRKRRAKKSKAQAILDRNAASQGRFWGGAKKLRSKPRVDEASSTQVSSGAAGYSVPSGTDFDGDGDTDIRNDRKRDRGSIYRGGNGDLEHNAQQIGRHFAGAEVIDDTYELLSDLLAGRDLTPAQTRRFKRSAHEG